MPTKTLRFSTLIFVSLSVVSLAIAQEPETKINPFADMLRQTSKKISDDEIREIMAIRERMGGGTKLDLDGYVAEQPAWPGLGVSEMLDDSKSENSTNPFANPSPAARMFMQHIESAAPISNPFESTVSSSNAKSNVSKMRDIAKRMELLAADIEELELFEDADLLRNRANKIRMQARKSSSTRQARIPSSLR